MSKPLEHTAYKIEGHIEKSGFRSVLRNCYFIDGEWYRPTMVDDGDEGMIHRQTDENDEIGWNYDILPDDYIIDSYEKEDDQNEEV